MQKFYTNRDLVIQNFEEVNSFDGFILNVTGNGDISNINLCEIIARSIIAQMGDKVGVNRVEEDGYLHEGVYTVTDLCCPTNNILIEKKIVEGSTYLVVTSKWKFANLYIALAALGFLGKAVALFKVTEQGNEEQLKFLDVPEM